MNSLAFNTQFKEQWYAWVFGTEGVSGEEYSWHINATPSEEIIMVADDG